MFWVILDYSSFQPCSFSFICYLLPNLKRKGETDRQRQRRENERKSRWIHVFTIHFHKVPKERKKNDEIEKG